MQSNQCPNCGAYAIRQKGTKYTGTLILWMVVAGIVAWGVVIFGQGRNDSIAIAGLVAVGVIILLWYWNANKVMVCDKCQTQWPIEQEAQRQGENAASAQNQAVEKQLYSGSVGAEPKSAKDDMSEVVGMSIVFAALMIAIYVGDKLFVHRAGSFNSFWDGLIGVVIISAVSAAILFIWVKIKRRIRRQKTQGIEVIIAPPQPSGYANGFLITRMSPTYGIACKDGTFVNNIDLKQVVIFETAEEAIQWAEAAPRKWTVLNTAMF
jgi:hypothetical protein